MSTKNLFSFSHFHHKMLQKTGIYHTGCSQNYFSIPSLFSNDLHCLILPNFKDRHYELLFLNLTIP